MATSSPLGIDLHRAVTGNHVVHYHEHVFHIVCMLAYLSNFVNIVSLPAFQTKNQAGQAQKEAPKIVAGHSKIVINGLEKPAVLAI